jgi:hypothetical protein
MMLGRSLDPVDGLARLAFAQKSTRERMQGLMREANVLSTHRTAFVSLPFLDGVSLQVVICSPSQ